MAECKVCHGIGEIRVRIPARFGSYYNYVTCPACAPAPEPEPAARKPVIIVTKIAPRLLGNGKK